jgi:hypothetical protein
MEYADDMTVWCDKLEVLDDYLQCIIKEGEPLGLIVNQSKTEYIHVVDGVAEKEVKLLGSYQGESWEKSIDRQIDKADKVFQLLWHRVWKISNISVKTKFRVFFSCVMPHLLFGLESLPLTNARLKRLDSFVYLKLRSILGYHWWQHVSYETLTECCDSLKLRILWPSAILEASMLRDYWHLFRHHTRHAIIGVRPKEKVYSRCYTLDRVICKKEGIELKDLLILAKFPDKTRDCDSIKELVQNLKEEQSKRNVEEKQRNFATAREWYRNRDVEVGKQLIELSKYRDASYLLGLGQDYDQEFKRLIPPEWTKKDFMKHTTHTQKA